MSMPMLIREAMRFNDATPGPSAEGYSCQRSLQAVLVIDYILW